MGCGLFLQRFSAYRVYLIWSGVTALAFSTFGTLSSVYRVEVAGLGPLELVLIGSVLELTVFLFEVPTGIVADVYSRRWSVIIGVLLIGAGFVLEGAVPVFGVMLVAQVIWGLGATFESGAIDAWLSDEIGEANANAAFLRSTQLSQLTGFVGIGLATLLGSFALGLPLVVGGVIFMALALLLTLVMPERGFTRSPDAQHNPLSAMRETFRAGLAVARRRRMILTIFAITAILGASSETFDRLSEAHFLQDIGLPDTLTVALWFGLIQAGISLVSIVLTEIVRRRVDTNAHIAVARALLAFNILLTFCVIAFGLAGEFYLALAFYSSARLLRVMNAPLYRAWLNQNLESQTRATVFSMNSQMDAVGQIAGGPLLGLAARAFGMPLAFVVAGLLLLPASYLYTRTLRKRAV